MCMTGNQIMVVRKQVDICLKMHSINNRWLIEKGFSINFDNRLWILPDFETLLSFVSVAYIDLLSPTPKNLSYMNNIVYILLKTHQISCELLGNIFTLNVIKL